jgi:hypothetical protein
MQHLYEVQSSAKTNSSATNIPAANTFSAEPFSIANDDCQMNYKIPYQQCQSFKFQLRRQQKGLNLDICTKNSIHLKPVECLTYHTANINRQ